MPTNPIDDTVVPAQVTVVATDRPPVPFITDHAITGRVGQADVLLSAGASPVLFGWTAPVAVPSPDGRYVAYSAWKTIRTDDPKQSQSQQGIATGDPIGRPSIRLVELKTGAQSTLEDGAYSLAWRSDGAVAYLKGDSPDYRANVRYTGDVVVRAAPGAPAQTWTTASDRYIVVAWAGDALLAYRMSEGERLDLLVLDGPGNQRILAPDSRLVAVGPDGRHVLVSGGASGSARMLDVASGKEVATSSLELGDGRSLGYLAYGGSWVGDRVVAESGLGLVVFDVANGLRVAKVLALDGTQFPWRVHEPQFTDETASRVIAWAPIPGSDGESRLYAYLDCDLGTAACTRGALRGDRSFYRLYSPSRPLAGAIE